jgi:zinc protease
MESIQSFSARTFIFALAFISFLITPPSAEAVTAQQVTSPGGIKAWFVSDHTNPILTIKFSFRGGAALDPVGKVGLANMVAG